MSSRPSRYIALTIALIYSVISYATSGPWLAARTFGWCVLPLVCIWFPEPIGAYTGYLLVNSITKESPAPVVYFMGWVVLFVPIIGLGLAWLEMIR